ncbi:MAG: alpha/beta hydrolase [Actinobacteria bacterium]|nr:alpha/beta hydrolase [Actinomycetota bacterium]
MSQEFSFIEVGGQRARALLSGDGEPVVVLHGWGGRIESMTPVIRCLSTSFRVIGLDLPGFGESPAPRGVWGTDEYAAFVLSVMGSLGVERAHFVGHSFGAKTALCLSAAHPETIAKMVLQGSSGLRSAPSLSVRAKRMTARVARPIGKAGPMGRRLKRALYARIASSDYENAGALREIFVKVVNEDVTEILPLVQSPTLLVWGTDDDAVPVAHGKTMEKLIPDAGLVLFEGAGHFAYLDEPNRFCQITRHFFGASVT